MSPPLRALLDDVARGRPPAPDGTIRVVPPVRPGEAAVLGFVATHVVVADGITADDVRTLPDADDLSGRFNPPFLSALSDRLGGRRVSAIDAVLVADALPGPAPLRLVEEGDPDHPRVRRAMRYRDDVRVWFTGGTDPDGVVLLGRGLAGRREIAFEVAVAARGRGLGRQLARAARHLSGEHVWAQVAPANVASLRVLLAAGYVPVGAEAFARAVNPPRRLLVAPERLRRWVDGFAARHGAWQADLRSAELVLRAEDGAVAQLAIPCPPLPETAGDPLERLDAHARRERTVGLLLLRRGGVAVGVAVGGRLAASKVDRRHVQGRTAAGGWSQQRFARRRAQQTEAVVRLAVDTAARVLLTRAAELDAVALGGDRLLLREVRADRRLEPLWQRPTGPYLDVRDPRLHVLEAAAVDARAVSVVLHEPR